MTEFVGTYMTENNMIENLQSVVVNKDLNVILITTDYGSYKLTIK